MSEFKSWRSFWDFSREVKHQSRFLFDQDVTNFLDTVLVTSNARKKIIKKGSHLWRAQLGGSSRKIYHEGEYVADEDCPHLPERMKPLADRASEGRANPKGIPYLYLATRKYTAKAEVRPWMGSIVSVAQFKIICELHVIDCSLKNISRRIYLQNPPPPEREEAVWSDIDAAFSAPVEQSDNKADYISTQIIAELFKQNGLDGIAYKSNFGEGLNIALFDIEKAILKSCHIYKADEIKIEFNEYGNSYFIKNDK